MKAVEVSGYIDERRELHLDSKLTTCEPGSVRVLVLIPDEAEASEKEWGRCAAANPTFSFLHDPEEDLYSLSDGKPLGDER